MLLSAKKKRKKELTFASEKLLNSFSAYRSSVTKWHHEIGEKERENERGIDITIQDGQVVTVRVVCVVLQRHRVTAEC